MKTKTLYQSGEILGQGTYSTVYHAIHTPTSNPVALKKLYGNAIQKNIKRVFREIHHLRLTSNHDNIATLYDVYSPLPPPPSPSSKNGKTTTFKTKEGQKSPPQDDIILAMEYAGGGELHTLVNDHVKQNHHRWKITDPFYSPRHISGGLPSHQIQSFMSQILSGLSHLHKHNIVHRDLKLDNILLSACKTRILIADLGLSHAVTPQNQGYLSTSCGSPHYASPEILNGKPYLGYPVDIWSTGVILYCLICGRLPFRDKDVQERFGKIVKGEYEMMTWWSQEEEDIIKGMLNVNVSKRLTLNEVMNHSFWTSSDKFIRNKNKQTKKRKEVIENVSTGIVKTECSSSSNATVATIDSFSHTTEKNKMCKDISATEFENTFDDVIYDEWHDDVIEK
eukprot:6623194-Ditylum_brightwellii.AAC.1